MATSQLHAFLFPTLRTCAINDGIPFCYRVHIRYKKIRMAGLESDECHMMIDPVVLAQYIDVTDAPTAT